jgi:hypothetical protein
MGTLPKERMVDPDEAAFRVIPSEFKNIEDIRKLDQLLESGLEFSELALMRYSLVNPKTSSPVQGLVTRAVVKVMSMVFTLNGKTAIMIMDHMFDRVVLEAYFKENPEEWKLIKDGIHSVIFGQDVLSQMLGKNVAAWMRDADLVAAEELYVESMNSTHGTDFDNIEDVLEHRESKQVPAPKAAHFCFKQAHIFRGTCDAYIWKPQDPEDEDSHIVDYQLLSMDQPAPDVEAETPGESDGLQTFMLVTRRVFSAAALRTIPIKSEIQYHIFKKYSTDLDESSKGRQHNDPLFKNEGLIGSIFVRHLNPDPIMGSGTLWDADLYLKKFKETDFP